MKFNLTILVILFSFLLGIQSTQPEWGFYGHRKINRKAVFTLPQELLPFYKYHIEFVTEHAVDPDKRRYATKFEAVRHYIDIDHWEQYPFDTIPREYPHAMLKYGEFWSVDQNSDTSIFMLKQYDEPSFLKTYEADSMKSLYYNTIHQLRFDDDIVLDCSSFKDLNPYAESCQTLIFVDKFSGYGILPYFFPEYYQKLVRAFKSKDTKRIIQYSADIGHYVGDAHVPLHTTENYNGQLTDQIGIHAFWESRLPELFADETYDFFVGKAEYIDNIQDYIWQVIFDSHDLLDEVLEFEKRLSEEFPSDQQFCFENRLEKTIRTQCEAYSEAYHTSLDGMVETRMRDAIQSIGSVWLSAWIDAGQPDLTKDLDIAWNKMDDKEKEELNKQFKAGQIKGRNHDN